MCKVFKDGIYYIKVRVTPKAAKTEIRAPRSGNVLIYVTETAENDRANKAVIILLSKALKISKSKFFIASGARNREKLIGCSKNIDLKKLF